MLLLKIDEKNHVEMIFKDFFTKEIKHSESFNLENAEKIAEDILSLIQEIKGLKDGKTNET